MKKNRKRKRSRQGKGHNSRKTQRRGKQNKALRRAKKSTCSPLANPREHFWEWSDAPILVRDKPIREEDIPTQGRSAWRDVQEHEASLWGALKEWWEKESDVICFIDEQTSWWSEGEPQTFDLPAASQKVIDLNEKLPVLFDTWREKWQRLVGSLWNEPYESIDTRKEAAEIAKLEGDAFAPYTSALPGFPILKNAESRAEAFRAALYRWDTAHFLAEQSIQRGHKETALAYTEVAISYLDAIKTALRQWQDGWVQEIATLTHSDIAALGKQRPQTLHQMVSTSMQ